ncbi:MAG: GntR family transcriptional regulator [Spirochaetia bacterium]|nr:GntR family transcriptional regulator [Spirochaetia bacterium]
MATEVTDLLPRHARTLLRLEDLISRSKVGERLATERELSKKFDVSRETIRKAMRTLLEKGVLESRQGSGTYVRKKIPAAAKKIQAARLLGVSVPTIKWPYIASLVSGMERSARECGYRIALTHDEGVPGRQLPQIESMLEAGVDGLLLFLDRDNVVRPEYQAFFKSMTGRPEKIVLVDRWVPGIDLPCVMSDTEAAVCELAGRLIHSGRKKIAVLSWGPEAGIAEENRMKGFIRGLRENGLKGAPVLHAALGYSESQETSARGVVGRWIREARGKLPFDAILSFFDSMALGAFLALKDAGLKVPEDVALTGFDHLSPEVYRSLGLELTTVEQPWEKIGEEAARRLVARIEGRAEEEGPVRHSLLPTKLVPGKSG